MLKVILPHLRAGMRLAMPVLHPQHPSRILLRAGYELDNAAVRRLRELRVNEIWIEYPGLEFVERFISPRIARHRGILADTARTVINSIQRDAHASLDYPAFRETLRGFIETLTEQPSAALMIQSMHDGDLPLMRHCADVCFLSLLMGLKLSDYIVLERSRLPAHRAKDVVELAIAALLHDVGMLALERADVRRWIDDGCPETDPAWRRHVLLGYDRLKGELPAAAANAVLHHHQHYDGSGFPLKRAPDGEHRPQAGRNIHVFARILTAADLYDRLLRPPGARDPVPPVIAFSRLIKPPYREWIDPIVLRALIAVAPPYPPGQRVTLSNDEPGVVIDWTPAEPCRPVVQRLDESPGAAEPARYDLRLRRDLMIAEVDGHDVTPFNFAPAHPREFAPILAPADDPALTARRHPEPRHP